MRDIPKNSLAALGIPLPPHRDAVPRSRTPNIAAATNVPASQSATIGIGNYFEALRQTPDRTPIMVSAFSFTPYLPLLNFNRVQLIALGRYLYDNNPAVGYAVNTIANYSVPVHPMASSDDPDWNELANDYFRDWCEIADFSGRFDFDTLQTLACRAIDTDGDIGFSATKENGPVQLQTFEGWQVGPLINGSEPGVIDGVRLDPKGRIISYLIYTGPDARQELDANQFILLYDPDRFLSYRGFSPMRRGSNDIRDAQDIKAFAKLATKIGAALAGVIESDGPLEPDVWGTDTGSADGSQTGNMPANGDPTATPFQKKLSVAELLGGDIPVLESGKFHQVTNNRPSTSEVDFIDSLAGFFVSGLELPPAFFLDTKLTGPNLRAVIGKAQRKFTKRSKMLGKLVRWAWLRVIGDAVSTGKLPANPKWDRIVLQTPPLINIDIGDMMSNEREDLLTGLISRRNHFANRSLDWQRETDQSIREDDYIIARCKEIATKNQIPVEIVLARYGYTQSKPGSVGNPQGNNAQAQQPNLNR